MSFHGTLTPPTNNSSIVVGAAGGPRGFAAGVTQVLVNFLLNYERGNLERMSSDIKKFEQERAEANQALVQQNNKLVALDQRVTAAQKAKSDLGKGQVATLNAIAASQTRINSLTQLAARNQAQYGAALTREKGIRDRLIANASAASGLSSKQVRDAANLASLERQLLGTTLDRKAAAEALAIAENKVAAAQRAQAATSQFGSKAAGRLSGLALGLIGGTIGGLAVSALITPVQDAITNIGEQLSDLANPANKAKEAADGVAEAIAQIGSQQNLSGLQAAATLLKQLNFPQEQAGALLRASDVQVAQDFLTKQQQVTDFLRGEQQLRSQIGAQLNFNNRLNAINVELTRKGADNVEASLSAINFLQQIGAIPVFDQLAHLAGGPGFADILGLNEENAAAAYDAAVTEGRAADAAAILASNLENARAAASSLADELAEAAVEAISAANISNLEAGLKNTVDGINRITSTAIDNIRARADRASESVSNSAERRINALQKQIQGLDSGPSNRTQALQRQLEALKDVGPSRQTKALADQIERLNKLQDQAAYRQSLQDVAEQRHAVLLAERLRLTKHQIDLDDYHGKDRLIAIDALLAKQQKANEAQDRFNKLLDIQYQIQQGVHREQGETIQDFIQRRAQYYRGLLQQAAELNRTGPQAELEAERARVEASVQLKDLEEKRRKLIEDRARELHMRSLQAQLQASQERDRKELESRKEALQKQIEASRKADQAALESRRQALQAQIEAVRKNSQQQIESIQKQRDADIAARELARDKAIAAVQRVTEMAIASEKKRAEDIKRIASQSETARLVQAFQGAQSLAQLQLFAGQLSGSLYAVGYLQQTGQYLGLDIATRNQIAANAAQAVLAYTRKLNEFYRNTRTTTPAFAEGGVFRLNNMNTPLGKDVRWGDGQGDEIGVVLSNKVTQALRDNGGAGGGPLIGGDVIFQAQDPWRDSYRFRRMARDVQRDEFN
jgi:hypothetical protein